MSLFLIAITSGVLWVGGVESVPIRAAFWVFGLSLAYEVTAALIRIERKLRDGELAETPS